MARVRAAVGGEVGGTMARIGARPAPESAAAAAMADTVQQLAVLLQAGAGPAIAWRHLADSGLAPAAVPVSAAVEAGASIAQALRAQGAVWSGLAAAWELAETVGAPLAVALRGYAIAAREAAQAADDVRVALSEPAATARLMAWLPPLGIVLGMALGFDPLGALLAGPVGWACLVAGIALIVTSRRWSARLVRRAQPAPGIPGLGAELLAVALAGGTSIERARALTEAALARGGTASEGAGQRDADAGARRFRARVAARAAGTGPAVTISSAFAAAPAVAAADASAVAAPSADAAAALRIDGLLALSRSAGVPIAELLRAEAERSRREARTAGRIAAVRLSASLLLPLGVCTLPAFMLLGVAPMAIAVLNLQGLAP